MIQKISQPKNIILILILALSAGVTAYLAAQLRQSHPAQPANYLAAEKGYGVTLDLTRYGDAELAGTLAALQKNGLTWLRQPIRWAQIEPRPGQFNWQPVDRILAAVARQNKKNSGDRQFKLVVVLHATPRWARPPHLPATAPPARRSDFGRFARGFAARYGPQLDYYQIWHQPNLSANWGNTFVEPAAYAGLLREAALNIRTVDPQAVILAAALAPTLENGPLNLNEVDYLDQLYRARASRWFDVVAGQPYGFDSEPGDPAQSDTLNFSRIALLRQVMLKYDDADTPIWATAFGWNALPANWAGPKSPWKTGTPTAQARRTAAAIQLARRNWPWLGPMLAVRWDATGLAADDPARGFSLVDTPPVLQAVRAAATANIVATPGRYPAPHPSGRYSPGWRFALARADAPRTAPRTLTITFEGTGLDLNLHRGSYRGYLWVTVGGGPANALPQDNAGRSYVVLYDPLRQSDSVTVARHLAAGHHKAVIEAEGSWGQWAISGWTVYNETDTRRQQAGLVIFGLLFVLSGGSLLWPLARHPAKILAGYQNIAAASARLGKWEQIAAVVALTAAFYLAPNWLALMFLLPLALAFLLHPELGLILIAFGLSFLSVPAPLPGVNLFPLELILGPVVAGSILRNWPPQFTIHNLKSADVAALALLALALLATLFAQNFGVSMQQWRTLVLPSVLFYFLVRGGAYFDSQFRLVDAFVAGAALQAGVALALYFWAGGYVTVEGVRRAVGVYESPNHLSLFLGRVWPILLAVTLLPGQSLLRRGLYGAALLPVGVALFLTFSKGALLVGLPAGLLAMALLHLLRYGSRFRWRVAAAAVGGLLLLGLILIPFSQTARFTTLFDFAPGSTGFSRIKLWQASVAMLRDHWLLGVGLDNFLYQYRTHYILPAAWQEPNLSHPHNLILDFGTRLGVGGVALLVWLQVAFWRNGWRLYKKAPSPLVLGLMGSMVVFLTHGLVDNAYFLVDLALAFFLIVGIGQQLKEQHA